LNFFQRFFFFVLCFLLIAVVNISKSWLMALFVDGMMGFQTRKLREGRITNLTDVLFVACE